MGKMISKMFATGISKIYYKVENEFVATGTLFTNFGMYYTAAHPALGLWMCGMAVDNNIIVIGFVDWANITRIVIDRKNENVFVVLKSYEEALVQVDKSFKMLYKKAYSHQMSDTGEMAFVTPLDLWSGNILPYLSFCDACRRKRGKCQSQYLDANSISVSSNTLCFCNSFKNFVFFLIIINK